MAWESITWTLTRVVCAATTTQVHTQGQGPLVSLLDTCRKHTDSLIVGIQETLRTCDAEGLRSSHRSVDATITDMNACLDKLDAVKEQWLRLFHLCVQADRLQTTVPQQVRENLCRDRYCRSSFHAYTHTRTYKHHACMPGVGTSNAVSREAFGPSPTCDRCRHGGAGRGRDCCSVQLRSFLCSAAAERRRASVCRKKCVTTPTIAPLS